MISRLLVPSARTRTASSLILCFSLASLLSASCKTQYDAPKREPDKKAPVPGDIEGVDVPAQTRSGGERRDDSIDSGQGANDGTTDEGDGEGSDAGASRTSAYRPVCTPAGYTKEGVFKLKYEQGGGGEGRMTLVSGNGFSCKLAADTSSVNFLPVCSEACPGDVDSIKNGWGWCQNQKGFACKVQQ